MPLNIHSKSESVFSIHFSMHRTNEISTLDSKILGVITPDRKYFDIYFQPDLSISIPHYFR